MLGHVGHCIVRLLLTSDILVSSNKRSKSSDLKLSLYLPILGAGIILSISQCRQTTFGYKSRPRVQGSTVPIRVPREMNSGVEARTNHPILLRKKMITCNTVKSG